VAEVSVTDGAGLEAGVEGEKEVMSRSVKCCFSNLALALALTVGAGAAFVASPAHADGKCDSLKNDKVKAVCAKGGEAGVKDYMKDLVKKVKAAGGKAECGDCHKDQKTFELKDGAEDKLKEAQAKAGV
jgi:hypothetical protein